MCRQKPLSAEPGWQRRSSLQCGRGGAAFVGCHPRPGMDGRHFNGCISLRDTHTATAAAAVERQPACSAVSGIPAFAPAPAQLQPKPAQGH